VSSAHDVPFYAEAFGLPEERVVPTGIPRMDLFFDDEYKAKTRELVHEAVPQTRGKKVILFAPTFRGNGPSNARYDYDQIDFDGFYELCEELDAVCVFKMHPFVIQPLEIPEEYADRFIDATESREINEFLVVADLVITDYSSLVFEYSTLNRPMLFFAYDLEEYISTRDFYEKFEEFVPGKIVRTFDELLDAVRAGDFEWEKVGPFAKTHLGHLDAGSTDRVIDQLILGTDTP
jgi:CDP-ribitol ribitolphosphotransferase / teichoic acid ribitol-phosphate polymerase